MDKPEYGIIWQKQNRLTDLDFADDVSILAEEENVCQEMTIKLEEQSAQVGLNISREKTKVMGITQRPSSQYYPISANIAQYPITQCQYRSNSTIFTQDKAHAYLYHSIYEPN